MDDDRNGDFAIGCIMMLLLGAVGAWSIWNMTVGQANRCAATVHVGTVESLDYSGGWSSGVLVEFEDGAAYLSSPPRREPMPAVGSRGRVCELRHLHRE